MHIGIAGMGTVGQAVSAGLSSIGHQISAHDIKLNTHLSDLLQTDIVFVCVPTDAKPDGNCDTGLVESVVEDLVGLNYQGVIAIKSTVIPGTTQRLINQYSNDNICAVPEFLRQKSAETDFLDFHDVLVIGTKNSAVATVVQQAHGHIPKHVAVITPTESEVVKYFNNVHNAMEIVFANAMHEMCMKIGADYQAVLAAVSKRQNINKKYLRCSTNYQGFAGHCLPKDTRAWMNLAQQLGVNVNLFADIVKDNERYTNENHSNGQ
jgi:UDPglucose 6-dehydrogenase